MKKIHTTHFIQHAISIGNLSYLFVIDQNFMEVKGLKKKTSYEPLKWVPFVQAFQNFVFELLKHPRTIPQNNNFLNST